MKGKYYTPALKILIFIIDFWLIEFAFRIARELGFAYAITESQFTTFFLVFSLIWIIAGFFYKIYRIDTLSLTKNISINLFNAFLCHLLMIVTILTTFPVFIISTKFLTAVYAFSAILIIGIRVLYKLILKYIEFSGFDQRKVIIVGATSSGNALYQFFSTHQAAGYQFKGFFEDEPEEEHINQELVVGKLKDIKNFCLRENIDEIYFALPLTHDRLLKEIAQFADDNFIYFRIAPDFSKVVNDKCHIFLINSVPVFTPRNEPLGISLNAILKRVFDIVFSASLILSLFPILFPVIAVAIRLDSEGPIFFKQLRPGKKNKLFDCYKFRTMYVNNTTEVQATKNDSRITKVGRFLRKTNMDELPQFFNVLLGNMSVVGPRPNLISQLEKYSKTIQLYKIRHFITPGITGYAQVNGFRGETKDPELMEKRIYYDVLYLENWSLALDIKIIFLTIWNMIKGDKRAY
ncbi:MAG: undecaprenyl-phosphate glucose phosphotransferase [Bacteroidetes bacterium]|nr:undecaprenyl-phosphate glucose phosphotransferase [Bacteroidota bacterium]